MRRGITQAGRCLNTYTILSRRSRGRFTGSQLRCVQISATRSALTGSDESLPVNPPVNDPNTPDASFEVLGAPYSLLSASLSASQSLYTRRGTLVGLSGKPDNVVSTLSALSPTRALLAMPFLYQKITSASPTVALISTKSPITSFATVHLDGTLDWMVAQSRALVAWTGQTLSFATRVNTQLSLANWGSSQVTGRGLLALAGKGQVYEVALKAGESYIAHPANILAYSISPHRPLPYRFKSSSLNFQVPSTSWLTRLLPETKFFRVMKETQTWRFIVRAFYTLRTWSRRTIWGDRLFLQFQGPTTILLQTRASRISDVLTVRDVNEIADSEPGVMEATLKSGTATNTQKDGEHPRPVPVPSATATKMSYATVGRDGSVGFEHSKS